MIADPLGDTFHARPVAKEDRDPANRMYEAQRYRPEQITIQGRLAGLIRRY